MENEFKEVFSDDYANALQVVEDAQKSVDKTSSRLARTWDNLTDEAVDGGDAWAGTARDISEAIRSLSSDMSKASTNRYFQQQYRAGNYESDVLDSIREQTGLTEMSDEWLKEHSKEVEDMLNIAAEGDLEAVNVALASLSSGLQDEDMQLFLPAFKGATSGQIDFSEAYAEISSQASSTLQAIAAIFASHQAQVDLVLDEDGTIYFTVSGVEGFGEGMKPSGGGGGGGKSAAEKLLEEQEREQKLWEHRRKMIQYEETRYQNAGELSNYAIMLGHEADEIQRQIE